MTGAEERVGGLRLIRRTLLVLSLALAANIGLTTWGFFRITEEGRERRHQTCLAAEGQDREQILRLARTYEYLNGLPPRERREPLNRFIVRDLPRTERDARDRSAPRFCMEAGIGLHEDDIPPMPERPRGLAG